MIKVKSPTSNTEKAATRSCLTYICHYSANKWHPTACQQNSAMKKL